MRSFPFFFHTKALKSDMCFISIWILNFPSLENIGLPKQ